MKKQIEKITNTYTKVQFVRLYKNIFKHSHGGEFSQLDKKLLDIKRLSSILEEIKEKELI